MALFISLDIIQALSIAATTRGYHTTLFRTQLLLLFSVPSNPTPPSFPFSALVVDIALSSITSPSLHSHRTQILATATKPDADTTIATIENSFALIKPLINRTASVFATTPSQAVACGSYVVVSEENARSGGNGWGGAEVLIPRGGKTHLDAPRFSRRDEEDLKAVGQMVQLVKEVVAAWDAHAARWAGGKLGKRNNYLALRKDFTPMNGEEWYGALGAVPFIMYNNPWATSKNRKLDSGYYNCDWVENDKGYRRWNKHGMKRKQKQKEAERAAKQKGPTTSTQMEGSDSEDAGIIAVVEETTHQGCGGSILHIYGPTGTGKSVLAYHLLQQLLREAMETGVVGTGPTSSSDNASRQSSSPLPPPTLSSVSSQVPLAPPTGISRPIILAYLPRLAGCSYQALSPSHVASSTHHASHSLTTLIAQYLVQDATSAHALYRLRRAIAKRNKKQHWWTGWSDEDLWLLFDGMLATREARQVWIVIDSMGDAHGQMRPKWLLQRLVDRIASGGAEEDGLVRLIITTQAKGDIVSPPARTAAEGYAYYCITPTTRGFLDASSAFIASQKFSEMEEKIIKRLMRRSGATWLDLWLTCSLRIHPGKVMTLSRFLARWETYEDDSGESDVSNDTDNEGHNAHARDDGWIVRETLYSMHYSFVYVDTLSHKRWARLALGWLLYISTPIRVGPLAMAIAISAARGIEAKTKEGNASESINIHGEFNTILDFLRRGLANTPFVQTIPATGDLDEGSPEHHKWGGEFIGIRHGQVQRFLLSRMEKEEDLLGLPAFSDVGRWNELMALTCFEVMGLPGADQVTFRGDGVGADLEDENEPWLELGDYKFDEDIWRIEGAGDFGLGDEKEEDEEEEEEVVDSDADNEDDNPAGTKADSNRRRQHGPLPLPIVRSMEVGHPAQRALLAYAILCWPTHAKTYYDLTHPSTSDGNSALPTNSLTVVIINFMTCNESEHILSWRERFSFLARIATSTSAPLSTQLAQNPLQLSANLGLLPLVKYFSSTCICRNSTTTTTSPPRRAPYETLKSKMLAMVAAATNGHIECFKHLFYMHTHFNYSVRYFFLSLVAAVRSGAVGVVKELLIGQEASKVRQALANGPMLWNYDWILKIAAESGNMEVMEVLLDEIPEEMIYSTANPSSQVAGERGHKKVPAVQGSGGEDGGTPLHFACRAGFTAIAKLLLHGNMRMSFHPFDPSTADAAGFTPLHHAARHGHLGIVKLLLTHHAVDVDTPGWVIKPLHLAAEKGYPRIVDELLRNHASTGVPDHIGRSPLHRACAKGHLWCVQLLLSTEPPMDVSMADKAGTTPLHLAADCGNIDIVNLLLIKGAKPNMVEEKTLHTPLHYAAKKGFVQIARRLLECGASCDARLHQVEYTPLHFAAFYQHVDMCKVLLEYGADVRAITKPNPALFAQAKDWNVLMLAYGAPGLTRTFIDAKADVSHRDMDGATPLLIACLANRPEAVAMLVGAGADVNIPGTTDDCTPLYIAARDNRLKLVKLLIAHGVDVEKATGKCPQRPLHVAAAYGHTETVAELIRHGANVNSVTQESDSPKTALYLAALGGHIEAVRTLLDNGSKSSLGNDALEYEGMKHKYEHTALCTAAQDGCTEILRLLLEKGVDVDQHAGGGDHGFTALYLALVNNHSACARLLLEKGKASPVKATVKQGWFPLHAAASIADLDSVQMLLKHPGGEVEVNVVTHDKGSTPLWLACRKENGHEVVKLLLANGADPTIANEEGWTVLHAAAEAGHIDCLRELLRQPNIPLNATMTERNRTALFCAAWKQHRDCVEALLAAGADPSIENSFGRTPLHSAANVGSIECVQLLLKHKVHDSSSSIMFSTICGEGTTSSITRCVRMLLDAGLPATIKSDGWAPLHGAAFLGLKEVLGMLLAQAPVLADIDYGNPSAQGSTALDQAAVAGNEDICRLLLEKGAGTEVRRIDSRTPLIMACTGNKLGVANALLDHGANWRAVTTRGDWCLKVALRRSSHVCAKAIATHPSISSATAIDNPLIFAASMGSRKTVRFLVDSGLLDVNCTNQKGFSALFSAVIMRRRRNRMYAAQRLCMNICEYLLDKGSAVDGSDPRWVYVPLFAAARLGKVDVMGLLLKHGADVSRRDALLNRTTLFFAVQAPGSSSVQCLEDACAARSNGGEPLLDVWWAEQVRQKDSRGRTPLWYAAAAGNHRQATVELLLRKGLDRFARDILGRSILEIVLHDNAELRKLLVEGLPQATEGAALVEGAGREVAPINPEALLQEPNVDADELKKLEGCRRYRSNTYIQGTTTCSECSESYMTGYFWRE